MIEIEDIKDFDFALRDAYVRPFYLSFLGENLLGDDISTRILAAARSISDKEIERLLAECEWRGRLCASWFVGLSKRRSFVPRIADLLMASAMVYCGRGYCTALGLIGTDECAQHLRAYLKKYLPFNGRFYDQGWAIGALAYIEGGPPVDFLEPMLWAEGDREIDPMMAIRKFKEMSDDLMRHHLVSESHVGE